MSQESVEVFNLIVFYEDENNKDQILKEVKSRRVDMEFLNYQRELDQYIWCDMDKLVYFSVSKELSREIEKIVNSGDEWLKELQRKYRKVDRCV